MPIDDRTDDEFARALLRSAETDAAPEGENDRAYARFVAAAGALAATAGLAATGSSAASQAAASSTQIAFGMKCALVGVLAGSALTYAWVGAPAGTARVALPAAALLASSSLAPPVAAVAAVAPASAPGTPPTAPAAELAPTATPARHPVALAPSPSHGHAPAPAVSVAPAPSATVPETRSLAAEVEALDAARAALGRSPDETLALLARYRSDFPRGKLGPEQEALAVEAYAAKGDHGRTKAAATTFLRAHPAAPQRARILELADRAGREVKSP